MKSAYLSAALVVLCSSLFAQNRGGNFNYFLNNTPQQINVVQTRNINIRNDVQPVNFDNVAIVINQVVERQVRSNSAPRQTTISARGSRGNIVAVVEKARETEQRSKREKIARIELPSPKPLESDKEVKVLVISPVNIQLKSDSDNKEHYKFYKKKKGLKARFIYPVRYAVRRHVAHDKRVKGVRMSCYF